MPTIEKSIDLDVPVFVAYDQWTHFEDYPRFMQGVKQVRQLDSSHVHWVADVGGREASWDAQITEQRPYQRIAWSSMGDENNAGVVTFQLLAADACRVQVHLEWESEGLLESVAGLLGADDRRVEDDLERFKEIVEARDPATGTWQ